MHRMHVFPHVGCAPTEEEQLTISNPTATHASHAPCREQTARAFARPSELRYTCSTSTPYHQLFTTLIPGQKLPTEPLRHLSQA